MKIISKIAAIAISAAMAACAFGCGSSDTSAQSSNPGFEPQDIEINDPGYSITDEGKLRYAFVAVNPNDGYVAENVIFTVEAYDASGSMIAGGGETIPVLYPGVQTAGAGEADLFSQDTSSPKVASLSVVAMMGSITWTATTITNEDIEDSIDIVDPRMSGTDGEDADITASIRLSQGDELKIDASKPIDLRVVALLFDEEGNAICGTAPVAVTLDSESETYSFNEVVSNTPSYGNCNLYVTPNGII